MEDGLAEAGGALEVGGHHRLQLFHHAGAKSWASKPFSVVGFSRSIFSHGIFGLRCVRERKSAKRRETRQGKGTGSPRCTVKKRHRSNHGIENNGTTDKVALNFHVPPSYTSAALSCSQPSQTDFDLSRGNLGICCRNIVARAIFARIPLSAHGAPEVLPHDFSQTRCSKLTQNG